MENILFFTCADNISYCNQYVFEGKAILIAGNGNFNVKLYEGKFNAYQRTYVLIPNDEKYYSVIFYAVKDQLKRLSNGSAGSIIKFITKGDVENIPLVLPKQEHNNMFKQINLLIKLIEKNKKQNQELSNLRDWLLPMLMNGQVKVK
jgi:type I restriction enzyme S subunit